MNEQQLADGFQAVLADEPPMGFDPDRVIDRAIKRRRRRRIVWVAGCATLIEAAVVWAMVGLPGSGAPASQDSGAGQVDGFGQPPVPNPTPPGSKTYTMTMFNQVLNLDQPTVRRPADALLRMTDLLVRNPDGDSGTIQLKRADEVVFEAGLQNFHDFDMHYTNAVEAGPGVPVTMVVRCTASPHECAGVSLAVSGQTVVEDR